LRRKCRSVEGVVRVPAVDGARAACSVVRPLQPIEDVSLSVVYEGVGLVEEP
jgi:hypothetical protein